MEKHVKVHLLFCFCFTFGKSYRGIVHVSAIRSRVHFHFSNEFTLAFYGIWDLFWFRTWWLYTMNAIYTFARLEHALSLNHINLQTQCSLFYTLSILYVAFSRPLSIIIILPLINVLFVFHSESTFRNRLTKSTEKRRSLLNAFTRRLFQIETTIVDRK